MASKVALLKGAALLCAAGLAGCSTTGGGASLASLSVPVPAVASLPPEAAPLPVPVNYGSFLGGPVGTKLPEADRTAALGAEAGAVASGERRTWKGERGVFGYVVPGPNAPADGTAAECRSFTATIFFAGRPQTGHGTGCRDADGSWHVTS